MTKAQIHRAIDNAYSKFEGTLLELAKAESAHADEIKAELAWLKWRKRYITSTKPKAYLQRAACEIEEFATEVQKSVKQ